MLDKEAGIKMSCHQSDILKVNTFTQNWYALLVCVVSSETNSVSQACSSMGIKLKAEQFKRLNLSTLNKIEVKKLYEKLKSVRKVAIELDCNQMVLAKFMIRNGIERNMIRHKISDKYNKTEIIRLRKEGKGSVYIAKIMGYEYASLYNFVCEIEKNRG